jgi:hypothetical protein
MPRPIRNIDPWPALCEAASALTLPGQPAPIFAALDRVMTKLIGAKLFTILKRLPETGEVERLYTNQPVAYPVGGRKQPQDTEWYRQVILAKRHYLGRTADDIRWGFADHELILSLGCESIINLLVIHNDEMLGSINMLHEAHWYQESDLTLGTPFAQLLIPALLRR